jgi:hypothetical protein
LSRTSYSASAIRVLLNDFNGFQLLHNGAQDTTRGIVVVSRSSASSSTRSVQLRQTTDTGSLSQVNAASDGG